MSYELPEDMVEQILSWLPPKSLLRCKSVCKSWCALINNPSFVSNHPNKLLDCALFMCCSRTNSFGYKETEAETDNSSIKFTALSFRNQYYVLEDINLPPHIAIDTNINSLSFLSHINGIICMTDLEKMILWNPTINECKFLTLPPETFLHDPLVGYEPISGLGFGYDPKSGHYQIVKISYTGERKYPAAPGDHDDCLMPLAKDPPRVDVYTLGVDDDWRQINSISLQTETTFFWPFRFLMCFKGICYWAGFEQQKVFDSAFRRPIEEYIRSVIILFDMNCEAFQTIPYPHWSLSDSEAWYSRCPHLLPWNETIALYGFHGNNAYGYCDDGKPDESFGIWVMDDIDVASGRVSWTEHATFEPPMSLELPNYLIDMSSFWKNNEILTVSKDGKCYSYNIGAKEYEYLPVPRCSNDIINIGVIGFVKSTVSVMGGW